MWRRETYKPGQAQICRKCCNGQVQFSQRRACRAIGQNRATQRYQTKKLPDEDKLINRIINLIAQYGRYGTPRITAMLHREGLESKPQAGREDMARARA